MQFNNLIMFVYWIDLKPWEWKCYKVVDILTPGRKSEAKGRTTIVRLG